MAPNRNDSHSFSFFCSTKHVSFARSHTLTSFDEASVVRSASRITPTKSQERLIGGKKPSIVSHGAQQQTQPQQSSLPQTIQALAIQSHAIQFHHHHQHHHQQQPVQVISVSQTPPPLQLSSSSLSCHQQQMPEMVTIEKVKRGSMKSQATQTGVYLTRKTSINSHLSLSPRTIHRVSVPPSTPLPLLLP